MGASANISASKIPPVMGMVLVGRMDSVFVMLGSLVLAVIFVLKAGTLRVTPLFVVLVATPVPAPDMGVAPPRVVANAFMVGARVMVMQINAAGSCAETVWLGICLVATRSTMLALE